MNTFTKMASVSLLMACATFAAPQFGIHLGAGLTGFDSDPIDMESGVGLQVGATAQFDVIDKLSFNPELLFSWRNSSMEMEMPNFLGELTMGETITMETSLSEMAIDIPLLMRYEVIPSLFIQAGPQVNYVFSSKATTKISTSAGSEESDPVDVLDSRNQLELGLTGGIGYKINSQIAVDLRYQYGLLNSFKDDEEELPEDELSDEPSMSSGSFEANPFHIMLGVSYLF